MTIQISEKDASQRYGMSVHWFRRKRVEGGGPSFRKIGNRCFYAVEELDRFFNERTCKSTSEYHTRKPEEAIAVKRSAKS